MRMPPSCRAADRVVRVAGKAMQPKISSNKTANTITVRATAPVVLIVERVIEANDKPRAEVIVDVQILEVSRERAKAYGLDLDRLAAGVFAGRAADRRHCEAVQPQHHLQGISTADFYMSVPSAVIRFLESDSQTKVLAKPNLRGTEGRSSR